MVNALRFGIILANGIGVRWRCKICAWTTYDTLPIDPCITLHTDSHVYSKASDHPLFPTPTE